MQRRASAALGTAAVAAAVAVAAATTSTPRDGRDPDGCATAPNMATATPVVSACDGEPAAIDPRDVPWLEARAIGGVTIFDPGPDNPVYRIQARVLVIDKRILDAKGNRVDGLLGCEPSVVSRTVDETTVSLACWAPKRVPVQALFLVESSVVDIAGEGDDIDIGDRLVDSCQEAKLLGDYAEFSCTVRNPGAAGGGTPVAAG